MTTRPPSYGITANSFKTVSSFTPTNTLGNILSAAFNMIPVVGTIKSFIELSSGNDLFTGEQISTSQSAFNVLASAIPFAAGSIGRFGTQAIGTSMGGLSSGAMNFSRPAMNIGGSATRVGSSELGNALSGLGRNPLGRNLNTLDEFGAGAGFSGVYDVATSKFLAYPSGTTRLANGGSPLNLVAQLGGHADVNRSLSQLLGSNSTNRLGFSMQLDNAGNFNFGWNSTQVNVPNLSFPGRTVPEGMRQQIIDAVIQSTGRSAH